MSLPSPSLFGTSSLTFINMFARKHIVSCFKFTKTRKTLLMFVAPSEVKSKNIAYAKKHLYLNLNENLNIYIEI